jgi:hypothetical protein
MATFVARIRYELLRLATFQLPREFPCVALVVYLVVAMDNPFRGELSVYPETFQVVQRSLMEPDR